MYTVWICLSLDLLAMSDRRALQPVDDHTLSIVMHFKLFYMTDAAEGHEGCRVVCHLLFQDQWELGMAYAHVDRSGIVGFIWMQHQSLRLC